MSQNDLISRAEVLAICAKIAEEAKGFGLPQMAMGALKCADDIRAMPPPQACPVAAEQLEELQYIENLIRADVGERTGYPDAYIDRHWEKYDKICRRVIAAEKLVEATEALAREMAFILRHNPEKDGGLYRATLDAAVYASTAYREASK